MSVTAEAEELERWRARVGKIIRNKWTIDALLGVGGMAAVYSATHKIGRRDAIKILHPEVAVSRELRARFEQEALAVGKLGHPGAVTILDIDVTEDGSPFLVMELLDGENLGQRAYRLGGIEEQELLGYTDQLLDVLGVAHGLGIVHRDIKPDNLFITKDGRLKVLDFGIARMKSGGSGLKTRTGAMMGTTSYMAPEQIHGRDIDGRADIFGVGATLFRVLAKRKLHEATSDADLLVKMGSAQAPSLQSVAPSVSVRVARIVDRALAFDADRRYPDAATMRSDVQAVLRGEDPPFSSNLALKTEAPTSAQSPAAFGGAGAAVPSAGAVAAVGAMALEPTGAPSSFHAPPQATVPAREPTAVTRAAPGAAEPTSFPVVIAQQPPASATRRGGNAPPLAVFAAIGGAMLLLGVGVGAWVMLRDSPRVETMDRLAAARIDLPGSGDAQTETPSAVPSTDPEPAVEAEAEAEAGAGGPSKPGPKPPGTQPPKPTSQPKPPNNSMKPIPEKEREKEKEKEKEKGKGKKKKKKDD